VGFWARFPQGAVIDEVQRVPTLLSYIQVLVDQRRDSGVFILTGSQNLSLLQAVTQTLAGRTFLLHLLPLGLEELRRFANAPTTLFPTLWAEGIRVFMIVRSRQMKGLLGIVQPMLSAMCVSFSTSVICLRSRRFFACVRGALANCSICLH
jgi:hypothetical protein